MTRKDSEKDSERPHYYSQFWLDIAAGRRTIGGPKPDEEGSESELAEPEPEPAPLIRRPTRSASYEDSSDGHADGRAERFLHPVAEPLATPEELSASEPEEVDLEPADIDGLALPVEAVDDIDIPDMDLTPVEEDSEEDSEDEVEVEGEEEEEPLEGEEEEEEEDIGWGGTAARGRKRNKPVRPKLPPKKVPRREPRRGY